MRGVFPLCLWAVVGVGPALGQERSHERPLAVSNASLCGAGGTADRLQAVLPHGDLVLASGGLASLSGIRLPEEPALREAALAWLRLRTGREVAVEAIAGRDRWERIPARLVLADGPNRPDLAGGLVEAGLALVDAGTAGTFCQSELLALEARARQLGLGLWADDRYNPVPTGHVDRLRERMGRFVLVEGRVRSVGERREWTYLNFGTDWASDFTIILPRKAWSRAAERGLTARTLQGRRIRARGILEDRRGPALTITMPEMIESLDNERTRR